MKKPSITADKQKRAEKLDSQTVNKKYGVALNEIEALERELKAALAIKNAPPSQIVIVPKHGLNVSEAAVVAVASDWHCEEEVKSSTVNGLNRFNLDIAKSRATTFFERVLRLAKKEAQDVKIDTIILHLGGDFISSNIHDELMESCLLRPIDAILYVQDIIEAGIAFLLNNSKFKLVIPCSSGNHARITKKPRFGTASGNSLEKFMYYALRGKFDTDRVQFIIEDGYHTYLPVFNYTLRLHHGENVKYQGGVGGLTIPMNKAIAQWDTIKQATCSIAGHWHQYMSLDHFVVNGSLIGYTPFAIAIKARYECPRQAFFLLDKARGKTVSIPIIL